MPGHEDIKTVLNAGNVGTGTLRVTVGHVGRGKGFGLDLGLKAITPDNARNFFNHAI